MKRIIQMLAVLSMTVGLAAQTLVQLPANTEIVKQLNLPVYFRDQQVFIVEANQDQLKKINQTKSNMKVLSENYQITDYYGISRKGGKQLDLSNVKGAVLYNNGNTAIVKATAEDRNLLWNRGCQALQMNKEPMVINHEKSFYNQKAEKSINPLIQSLVSEVKVDSIRSYIQKQQDMQTRFCFAPNRRSVATWIKNKFIEVGVTNAVLDSFYIQTVNYNGTVVPAGWHYNVTATITGTVTPDEVIVVGGHHDSIVGNVSGTTGQDPFTSAPGADDNASAVANCLENARVIIKKGYQPKSTIKFQTYTAEEIGLYGSKFYATKARQMNENIKLMINTDMIATNLTTNWVVKINPYTGYESFAELNKQITQTYTTLTAITGDYNSQGSDSYSFFEKGYPATYFEENDFSPSYHSYNDVIANCNIPYCAEVVKASTAMLIHNIEAPNQVRGLSVVDQGSGTQLKAIWRKNKETDISSYKAFIGTTSGVYTQNFSTTDTVFTFNGLTSGVKYFVGIMAIDTDQNESMILEGSGIPRITPLAPQNISVEPLFKKVKIQWSANSEPDIAGYNLYRSLDSLTFDQINSSLITGLAYEDNFIASNNYRYYKVTGVDQDVNESAKSGSSERVKPVTLDRGIMLVDETANGSGTASSPNDIQQDQFFYSLTANCPVVTNFDMQLDSRISLSELGAFSTVIWHNQSVELSSVFNKNQNEIKKYLDLGGKMIITADKPGKLIASNNTYPTGFAENSLLNQYFGIDTVDYKSAARFSGAFPNADGYNYLRVDSAKALEANGFHLKKIETIHAKSASEIIYEYGSDYQINTSYGALKGKTVGVLHFGTNYKTATLAIPLYFIKQGEAKQVIEYILKNKFGETVNIDEADLISGKKCKLSQNYPNPFNNTTVINYQLDATSIVKLAIYNAKGELVQNLVDQNLSAGKHSVSFNAANFNSGVYFYKLEADGKSLVRKMLLIK